MEWISTVTSAVDVSAVITGIGAIAATYATAHVATAAWRLIKPMIRSA